MKKISFTLNGQPVDIYAEPGEMLVDVLRDRLALTGTKIGCLAGDCGACTVIINGQAVNSCITPMGKVAGAAVETIEGVGTPDYLHPLQQAMIDNGSVQCGFCFPGMVMSSKALLDHNPSPDSKAIRTAPISRNCSTATTCPGSRWKSSAAMWKKPWPKPTRWWS